MLPRVLTLYGKVHNYVTVGLFLCLLCTTVLWRFSVNELALEKAGRKADTLSYVAAQEKAKSNALELKIEQEKKDAKRKEDADATADGLRRKYDSLLQDYARAQSKARAANLPSPSKASQGSNGPSGGTELPETIEIPYDDARICAVNTARLEAVHQWATSQ